MVGAQPAREDALNYYDREPYGDEQDGASQVVTSEFADVIESIMPGLMRVFTSTDDVAEFTPARRARSAGPRRRAQYVPHVFMRQNDGFRILYWMIKDALMYRLGAVTVDLEDFTEKRRMPVHGLPQDALDLIVAQAEERRRRAGDGAGAGSSTQHRAPSRSPGFRSRRSAPPFPAPSPSAASASAWWPTTSRPRTSCSRPRRATSTRPRSWASASGSPRPTWSRWGCRRTRSTSCGSDRDLSPEEAAAQRRRRRSTKPSATSRATASGRCGWSWPTCAPMRTATA